MATKNNPGRFDCYAHADPDEPMFILLARDKHAPTLIWLWCALRELDQEVPEKVTEARDCVTAMIEWQHAHGRQSVGVGQAALVGVMELIRAANVGHKLFREAVGTSAEPGLTPTRDEAMRMFLTETRFPTIPEGEG